MAGDRGGLPPPETASAGPGAGPGDGQQSLILDQAFDRDTLYQLRAAVSAHGAEAGLPPARVGDLVLAVHELAANAVRHGAGHGRLLIWRNHQALHCQVTDDGAAQVTGNADWGAEPGHGLWLVRQVADQASWRSAADGTTALISFTLAGQPAGA